MAQPEEEGGDGAPEADGYLVGEAVPLVSRLAEYGAAAAMFAGMVWARDVPMEAVAGLGTFVAVVLLANHLFSQLGGVQRPGFRAVKADGTPLPGSSRWTSYSQSGLFGALVAGIADFFQEYVADIGVGGFALAGFVVALAFSGWRQRWNERRVYRETLITP